MTLSDQAKWPRTAYCCMYPGCGYISGSVTVSSFTPTCPSHGTPLVWLAVSPHQFDEKEERTTDG